MSNGEHGSDGNDPYVGDDEVIELDSLDMQMVESEDGAMLDMDDLAVLDAIETAPTGTPPTPPPGVVPSGVPAGVPVGTPVQTDAVDDSMNPFGDDGLADLVGEVFETSEPATPADPIPSSTPVGPIPPAATDAYPAAVDEDALYGGASEEDLYAAPATTDEPAQIDEDAFYADVETSGDEPIDEDAFYASLEAPVEPATPADGLAAVEQQNLYAGGDGSEDAADAAVEEAFASDAFDEDPPDFGDEDSVAEDDGEALALDASDDEPISFAVEDEVADADGEAHAPDASPAGETASEPAEAPLIQPPPPELADEKYLGDQAAYRSESRKLVRSRKWDQLAEITSNSLKYASWAGVPEVRSSLLTELARLYEDRIKDSDAAERTFSQLATEDPTNRDALSYLDARYREVGNYRALHDLYAAGVERTWDPAERLDMTRQAVELAESELDAPELAIKDWEHLWGLGETSDEVADALTEAYRQTGAWAPLAEFIEARSGDTAGATRRVYRREVAEIYVSALRSPQDAAPILEQIRAERPLDPVALLTTTRVAFQARDFDQLAALSRIDGLDDDVARDIRRVSADALWQAGERELAVDVYERLLEDDPDDRDALRAKESFFSESGNYTALCAFLEERAAREDAGSTERYELLRRAGEIAETALGDLDHAIGLWQRIIDDGHDKAPSWKKLVELYESAGNMAGVASALQGLLDQTAQPAARVDILGRLGELYAHHLDDDQRAEDMYRALLNLVPGDAHAQAELADIYAKRGDFDALDQTLRRQVASATDDRVLELVNAAARNVEEHINDSGRGAAAWEQVLDYAPEDIEALSALARRLGELDRNRERIAALELRILACDPEARIEGALELAELWLGEGQRAAAIASWERVLRWDPTNETALAQLERQTTPEEQGAMRSALELAANLGDVHVPVLSRTLDHIALDDDARRANILRRLVASGDEASLEGLRSSAAALGDFEDLVAEHQRLASDASDAETRARHLHALAGLAEKELSQPVRALAAVSSIGYDAAAHERDLAELDRLCRATERWEVLLSIHDGRATADADPATRRSALDARAGILQNDVASPARAFEEVRRILVLDPSDRGALERAEAIATEHELHRRLAGLYGVLWDVADDEDARADIARRREALAARTGSAALEETLLRFRVSPTAELRSALLALAESNDGWPVVLPRIEAATRSADAIAVDDLIDVAGLYETKVQDADRALELLAEALVISPERDGLVAELVRVADAAGKPARLAQALRSAAARAEGEAALVLYRRVAELYRERLHAPERAVDIHRRILRIEPEERASIDALIAWHRERAEWSELRDRLSHRAGVANEGEDATGLWMEVAAISREHLDDPEGALEAYSKILADDGAHEGARQGVQDLTGDSMSPEVQARRLRLELRLADEHARADIMLQLAELQETQLKRIDAAQETLYKLIAETGAAGPGFEPLSRLLEQREAWSELMELLESHANERLGLQSEANTDDGATDEGVEAEAEVETASEVPAEIDDAEATAGAEALRRALELCDEHGGGTEAGERLARKLRAQEPEDRSLLTRLAQAMRASGRWEELAGLLEEAIDTTEDPDARLALNKELARVVDLNLDRADDARTVLTQIVEDEPDDVGALYHLAGLARRAGDLDTYVALREQATKYADPKLASLTYCHLAEVHDEADNGTKVAAAYRQARALDRDNPIASDALRALGRRNKNWRQSSALLAEDGERDLTWADRAARLVVLAREASDDDTRHDLLLRAIASAPEAVDAWTELAALHASQGDPDARFEALLGAVGAFERSVTPQADELVTHAQILHEAADAARLIDDDFMARQLDSLANTVAPHFAPAALAVADARALDGDLEGAFELYHTTLTQHGDSLDENAQSHAVFRRGALAAELGNAEQAIDDLRATVRANPLHLEALDALARLHDDQGHPALAVANLQQALVVAVDADIRGGLYHRLGKLWEDGLSDADEAGPYYELALEFGAGDAELMKRALDHYRRDGRFEEALSMVQELTRETEDPKTLATLFITRGEILEVSQPDEAIEAFDMALSYEPGHGAALDGLERMLTAREEWEQLADLLEGRIDGTANPDEQCEALMRLADLCEQRLEDVDRANGSLRRLLEIKPSAEAVTRLLANLGDSSPEERQALLEHAIEAGGSRFDRAIELANLQLSRGRRHQAWAILSPLRVVIHMSPELKETVNDLRGEFERNEPEEVLAHLALARGEQPPLRDAMIEAFQRLRDLTGPIGRTDLDSIDGAVQVSESTPNGKLFAQLRDAIGVDGAELWRASELDDEIVIADGDPVRVCIKTEIFQKASRGELHFWLAMSLELASEMLRGVASLSGEDRMHAASALLAELGLAEASADAGPIRETIAARLTEEGVRDEMMAILEPTVEFAGSDGAATFWTDSLRASEKVAGMVVFDLRAAWRALSRMYGDIPEQRSVKSLDDLNELFDNSPEMGALLRFYVTDEFGSWLP